MSTRRLLAWVSTCTVVGATLLAVVLAVMIGSQTQLRFDLTRTGQHMLSPRTVRLIDHLADEYEFVLAIDRRSVDRQSFDAVVDLLTDLARRSEKLGFRLIDVGSSTGRSEFEALVDVLRERDRPTVEQQVGLISKVLERINEAADLLDEVADQLDAVVLEIPVTHADAGAIRRFMEQASSLARAQADQSRTLTAEARSLLMTESSELANTPAVRDRLLPAVDGLRDQIETLANQLGRYASTEAMPEPTRSPVATIARRLLEVRDGLAAEADRLRRLDPPAVFRVAGALEAGEACILIGPPDRGLTAIDRATLFPPTEALGSAGVAVGGEIARRAEDLCSIALTTLTSPNRPILVFVHAEIEPFVLSSPTFEQLVGRARLRGMDVLEWAVVSQPDAPPIETIDPDGLRPVVYLVISPNSAAASPTQDQELSGARRASHLGMVVRTLVDRGQSVLLSVNPSIFPTYGDDDPVVAALAPLGITAHTGTPIVAERMSEQGRTASTSIIARGVRGPHPLQVAMGDLPTRLLWPIAIDSKPTPGVTHTPLLTLQGDDQTWMESQWISLWQSRSTPGAAQVPVTFDPARDARRDTYLLAAAAERMLPDAQNTQRIVVVGSNAWLLDRIAQPRAAVDGRLVAVNPGNLELFDASVAWLAGADEQIARGVSTGAAPVIGALEPADVIRLRWITIAGVPLLILAFGALFRLVRG